MFYPSIREEQIMTLNVVLQSLEKDPDYLDKPECPYPETVKAFFRKSKGQGPAVDLFQDKEESLVLGEQIQALINDLESFSKGLTNADHSEKLQYFKTKTSLIEKLINMQERVLNLKEISEFRHVILGFMDEICSKDQITDLMKRLDGILGTSNDNL